MVNFVDGFVYRATRTSGSHIHAVKQSLTQHTYTSLCPLGPNAIWEADLMPGSPEDVTCPQCRKRLEAR